MKKIKRKVWIQNCGVRKLTELEKGLLIDMAVDGWWRQMKASIEVEGHRLKSFIGANNEIIIEDMDDKTNKYSLLCEVKA